MYYPPVNFGDDMPSGTGFCFRVLAHTHIDTHTYTAVKRPTPATIYIGVSKNSCETAEI